MLKLTNIDAGYGPKQVLRDVSLEVKPGEVVALLGPNGAGKSTVLKVVAGLLRPTMGTVSLCDKNITSLPSHSRVQLGIGYTMQNAPLFGSLTAAEHQRLAVSLKEPGTKSSAVPGFSIDANKTGGVLSGGERHRLAVELCLRKNPKLLLLDEPSAGVAPGVAMEIYAWIKERIRGMETAVLVVEQNLHFLPNFATRVVVMRNGKIFRDNLPLETLENSEAMFEVFYSTS